jgi:hypothetical protein
VPDVIARHAAVVDGAHGAAAGHHHFAGAGLQGDQLDMVEMLVVVLRLRACALQRGRPVHDLLAVRGLWTQPQTLQPVADAMVE